MGHDGLEGVKTGSGDRRSGHDGSIGVGSFIQFFPYHGLHQSHVGIRSVGLGDDGDDVGYPQVVEDLKMFLRLRHPAVIRSNDQQGAIDRADPGHHVLDEILVTRHVNHAEIIRGLRLLRVHQRPLGKAQIDRNPSTFFLGQPVGDLAGQILYQSTLAMVDMAGCGHDKGKVAHACASRRFQSQCPECDSQAFKAAISSESCSGRTVLRFR